MTERLYFTDSYLADFESAVTACAPANDRFEITLAATAFYPTGGGQPNDTGTLGGRVVSDVVDRESDGIVHVVDGPLTVGERVRGLVDWKRRFDHMQQHSGQHLLSAAFEAVCQARTASFHLGTVSATIDLDRVLTPADIAAAEGEANRIVWQDREVRLRFSSKDDASALALRKESAREGTLRLIEVEGFDLSACGGTHVPRTGVVGIISVVGWEKFKGGTRVEFVCGGRALGHLREWRDVFSATSKTLSVVPTALPAAIEKLQDDNKAQGKAMRDLQGRLAAHEASRLVAAAERNAEGRRLIVQAVDDFDANGLKSLALAAAATAGVRVAVFSKSTPTLVVVARASDVSADAGAVVKELVTRFGGKGGGRPELAQAGGLTGDVTEMIRVVSDALNGSRPVHRAEPLR